MALDLSPSETGNIFVSAVSKFTLFYYFTWYVILHKKWYDKFMHKALEISK